MRRVVVTGMGIVSPIGTKLDEVINNLKQGKSGIVHQPNFAKLGFRSQVVGMPTIADPFSVLKRRETRFMGQGAAWAAIAMDQAIGQSNLDKDIITSARTGLIVGSGGPSTKEIVQAAETTKSSSPKRIGPFAVPKTMSSSCSATLAVRYGIKGLSYSISSACSSSSHCIGAGTEAIQYGKLDTVLVGGGEELEWTLANLFDAMGALSSQYNDKAHSASRAFDKDRDGFVIAGGAGALVLEEYEQAKARGAHILAEIGGYAANSDGHDMVSPSGEGAVRCMKMALEQVSVPIDYINPHATSTPVGDVKEVEALREVFGKGKSCPPFSSTKSLTGHSLGATGVQEVIYCILMMQNNFICGSANIENLDENFKDMPVAMETVENVEVKATMSNSFGFGGTNASIILINPNICT